MKICQINCVYGKGSTGKIVASIHKSLLRDGEESIAVCSVKDKGCSDTGVYGISNKYMSKLSSLYRKVSGRQFDGAVLQSSRLIKLLREEKPDLVHLHSINGNNINIYRLMNYLSANGIPTVITLHAEFQYTGGCGHAYGCEKWKSGCGGCPILREATQSFFFDRTAETWRKQKECYSGFASDKLSVVAVSPWLMSRAEQSPMLKGFPLSYIYNGVDTSVFYRRCDKAELIKKHLGECNDKILLHVTANFDATTDNPKGGNYIVELAEQLRGEPIKIVVVANRHKFDTLPDNVIFLGRTQNQDELAELYSIADLSIIVSKRETFSMPLAESMCCGTPVAGFYACGPESIAIKEYSRFAEYGNVARLKDAVTELLSGELDGSEIEASARAVYSEQQMTSAYKKLYTDLLIR